MRRWLVRLLHRGLGTPHRFEPCTLVDLAGDQFTGRCCRLCGCVDENHWQWIGSVYQRGTP